MEACQSHRPSALISPALEKKLVTIREITEIHRTCKLRFKGLAVITPKGVTFSTCTTAPGCPNALHCGYP